MIRRQRLLVLGLVLSVAANLLLLGALLGRWQRGPEPPPVPLAWSLRALDPEERAALRPLLQRHLASVRPLRRDLRRAGLELRELAAEEPFDRPAMERGLEALRDASARYQTELHAQLLTLLEQLPGERRQQLLERALRGPGAGNLSRRGQAPGAARPPGSER